MDPRFDISRDPRFKRTPGNVRRVGVDKRFSRMFEDKDFVETSKVDSRGQRLRRNATKQRLKEYYKIEDEADVHREVDDENASATKKKVQTKKVKPAKSQGVPEDIPEPAEAADSEVRPATKKKVKKKKGGKVTKSQLATEIIPEPAEDASQKKCVKRAQEASDDESTANNEDDDNSCDDDDDDDDDDDPDDEDEDDSDEEQDDEQVESAVWAALDENDVPKGDATKRVAIMGCDWNHVGAGDILMMLRTFLSGKEASKGRSLSSGTVDRVLIFPSEYGVEQMAKENELGPMHDMADELKEAENDEAAQAEAVRKYQLQRTKYYFALAECDSAATASWLYDQLDGLETDGMGPVPLDLRFVPDDLVFPRAHTSEATEPPSKYQGPVVQNATSLQHSKVQCTWDEAPTQRTRDLVKKRFKPGELKDMDLKAYLASSSEDDESGGAETLRRLVRDGDDFGDSDSDGKEEFGDMEATFSLKATELEGEITEKIKNRGSDLHQLDDSEKKGTWDAYLEKRKKARKERKSKAKAERAAKRQGTKADTALPEDGSKDAVDLEILAGEEEDQQRDFNLRGPQRRAHAGMKRQKSLDAEGSFKLDVDDPRIAKVFSSTDFEIDPTNPQFRQSEGMQEVLRKKRHRKRS